MIISLTADERAKFAAWLRQEAASNEAIIEQMGIMPGLEGLMRSRKFEVLACKKVENILSSIEDQSIGKGGNQ